MLISVPAVRVKNVVVIGIDASLRRRYSPASNVRCGSINRAMHRLVVGSAHFLPRDVNLRPRGQSSGAFLIMLSREDGGLSDAAITSPSLRGVSVRSGRHVCETGGGHVGRTCGLKIFEGIIDTPF